MTWIATSIKYNILACQISLQLMIYFSIIKNNWNKHDFYIVNESEEAWLKCDYVLSRLHLYCLLQQAQVPFSMIEPVSATNCQIFLYVHSIICFCNQRYSIPFIELWKGLALSYICK